MAGNGGYGCDFGKLLWLTKAYLNNKLMLVKLSKRDNLINRNFMSNIEDLKNVFETNNITLSDDELANLTTASRPAGSRTTKPFMDKVYVGYDNIHTRKRIYYMAEIADPQPEKRRPLYLSIYFGDVFTTDVSKALAGRDSQMPFLTVGPFTYEELNSRVPVVGFEFDAPIVPYNNKLIIYREAQTKAQQSGEYRINVVGNAVLWGAECDTERYGDSSPADEKATVYDRRLFSTMLIAS